MRFFLLLVENVAKLPAKRFGSKGFVQKRDAPHGSAPRVEKSTT
jgi:hypothetical protein